MRVYEPQTFVSRGMKLTCFVTRVHSRAISQFFKLFSKNFLNIFNIFFQTYFKNGASVGAKTEFSGEKMRGPKTEFLGEKMLYTASTNYASIN